MLCSIYSKIRMDWLVNLETPKTRVPRLNFCCNFTGRFNNMFYEMGSKPGNQDTNGRAVHSVVMKSPVSKEGVYLLDSSFGTPCLFLNSSIRYKFPKFARFAPHPGVWKVETRGNQELKVLIIRSCIKVQSSFLIPQTPTLNSHMFSSTLDLTMEHSPGVTKGNLLWSGKS